MQYGDKIFYSIGTTMLGVVNCDGTSRYRKVSFSSSYG